MTVQIIEGDVRDALAELEPCSIHCCVTSPPYWGLRDYGVDGQIGLEKTPDAYAAELVEVFRAVREVLRDDGTLWVNLGDSYNGSSGSGGATEKQTTNAGSYHNAGVRLAPGLKPKDLVGIPWRVAFALQADGWFLRSDIIWHKPNPMPESVTDRPTKAHEYVFLLAKSRRYCFDADAVAEPSTGRERWFGDCGYSAASGRNDGGSTEPKPGTGKRNIRSVWQVASKPYAGAHFATFPPKLIEPCIKAGCPEGGTVLDPFGGAGTTGLVANRLGRNSILIELNPEYAALARERIRGDAPLFSNVT